MLKVGLTGGIGSGKTTVAKIFEQLGVPVYYADQAGKKLTDSDPVVREKIAGIFGQEIYSEGKADRKKIAEKVFKNPGLLEKLNQAIHPAVKMDFELWLKKNQDKPYILKEAAIIFESGTNKDLDKVITVSCPKELRVQRVARRDHVSEQNVAERMKNQLDEAERNSRADIIIFNDEKSLVIPQVLEIHKSLSDPPSI